MDRIRSEKKLPRFDHRNDDGAHYDDDDAHRRSEDDGSKSGAIVVMIISTTAEGHEPQEDEMEEMAWSDDDAGVDGLWSRAAWANDHGWRLSRSRLRRSRAWSLLGRHSKMTICSF